jgi:hypothetical protein
MAYVALANSTAVGGATRFDDVVVYEGTTRPSMILGGYGPGMIPGTSKVEQVTGGVFNNITTDPQSAFGVMALGTGALTATSGILDYPLLPHLFEPDDYTSDEIDIAVFARVLVASTQTGLTCAMSMSSNLGTNYGSRRYGSYRSGGKAIKLPSSGQAYRPVFLGTITMKVNKSKPRREWLRLHWTNSGSASGNIGIDHILVIPVRSCARSQSGDSESIIPDFIMTTAETTKSIGIDSNGRVTSSLVGGIVDHVNGGAVTPDDGLLGSNILFPNKDMDLLVWPTSVPIDMTDSNTSSSVNTAYPATVQVAVQPRVHILKQV